MLLCKHECNLLVHRVGDVRLQQRMMLSLLHSTVFFSQYLTVMSPSDPITDCRRSHFYVLLRVKSILSVSVISSDGMCSVSLCVSYPDECFGWICHRVWILAQLWDEERFQLIWIHVPLEAFFTITTYVVSYILKYIPCCIRTAVLMFWRDHKLIQMHTSFWIQGLLGGGSGAADWWKSWRNKVFWSMLALQILSESFHSLTSILNNATLRSALAMRLFFSDSWTQTNSNVKSVCYQSSYRLVWVYTSYSCMFLPQSLIL